MAYDSSAGSVTATGPGMFKPLGRVKQQDEGWLSWDSMGRPVLRDPAPTRDAAITSLVRFNGLGSGPYSITAS